MKPVVDRLEKQYKDKLLFKVYNLTSGGAAAESVAQRMGVQYVPTFAFLDAKGATVGTVVGETLESDLRRRLDDLL